MTFLKRENYSDGKQELKLGGRCDYRGIGRVLGADGTVLCSDFHYNDINLCLCQNS
jgi:hypothetical protein